MAIKTIQYWLVASQYYKNSHSLEHETSALPLCHNPLNLVQQKINKVVTTSDQDKQGVSPTRALDFFPNVCFVDLSTSLKRWSAMPSCRLITAAVGFSHLMHILTPSCFLVPPLLLLLLPLLLLLLVNTKWGEKLLRVLISERGKEQNALW